MSKSILKVSVLSLTIFFSLHTFALAQVATSTVDTATSTPLSIHLDIESATSTIFDGTVMVSACASSASSTEAISGYCAIKQSGLDSTWSSYGDAQFLDSISGVANDYQNNLYWSWFSNYEFGQTSLDQHLLTPDENLVVTIGRMPLKITVSTTTPSLDATTTLSVTEFGFDSSWNGVWLPSASSTIAIGSDLFQTDTDGNYAISISTSTPFEVFATKDNFIKSNTITISPVSLDNGQETIVSTTTSSTTDPTSSGSSSSGGGNSDHCTFDVTKAVQFLGSKQRSDGSFGSSLYTDWAAIALASGSQIQNRDDLISYLKNSTGSLSSVTDYERHAMALMALGVNPYNGTSINYIQKISDQFDGTQIGDPSLVNDDIFALFPLLKSGYSTNDPIIQKTVAFIISKQKDDGSWEESVDITAAAIQALGMTPSLMGVSQAMSNAKNYLTAHQENDGGFGSSFSTSWTIQAITALGQSSSSWVKNAHSPQYALCLLQQSDGGLEPITTDDATRIWATSYAIPAVLNKSWPMILSSFSRQETPASSAPPSVVTSSTVTSIATSSIALSEGTTTKPIPHIVAIQNESLNRKIKEKSPEKIQKSPPIVEENTPQAQSGNPSQLTAAVAESKQTLPPTTIVIVLGSIAGLVGIGYVFKIIKNNKQTHD